MLKCSVPGCCNHDPAEVVWGGYSLCERSYDWVIALPSEYGMDAIIETIGLVLGYEEHLGESNPMDRDVADLMKSVLRLEVEQNGRQAEDLIMDFIDAHWPDEKETPDATKPD